MGRSRRVTLRDIAADTGLSVAAVSYALRGLHVPADTQERVRESAARLGYTVDPIARALASGRTDHVGVVCRSLADLWQQRLVADLGRALLGKGLQTLVVDSGEDEQREAALLRRFVDQRVDALVVLPIASAESLWAELAEECVLISVGEELAGVQNPHGSITFDNGRAALDGLGELLRLGHRQVTVLSPIGRAGRPAELAVRGAAAELGVEVCFEPCPSDLEGAAAVADRLLRAPHPPSAFWCLSDSMAYGVYAAARVLGLDIPDDLSVLGADDNDVSALLTPGLSSARWPMGQIVTAVVEAVTAGIDGDTRGRRTVISPEVQWRGSHGERAGAGRDDSGAESPGT